MKKLLACILSVLLLCSCSQENKKIETAVSDESITPTSDNLTSLTENEYSKPEKNVNEIDYLLGNSTGNIVNGGIATIQDDWIFCSIIEEYKHNVPSINNILIDVPIYGFYKIHADGSEKIKLDDCDATYINVVNDWVYYAATTDDYRNHIYKIKTDGTEKTLLNNEYCNYVSVCNDWIYYASDYPPNIYKMRTDGTEKTLLIKEYNGLIKSVATAGEWIYYIQNIEGKLYKIKTDGTENVNIEMPSDFKNYHIFEYAVVDDCIYMSFDGIYKLSASSKEIEKISDGRCNYIVVDGDWIFYSGENGCLYKIKTDGSEKTQLNNEYTEQINVVGDYIFYRTGGITEAQVQYRIRTDGTELQKVGTAEPMKTIISPGQALNYVRNYINGDGEDVFEPNDISLGGELIYKYKNTNYIITYERYIDDESGKHHLIHDFEIVIDNEETGEGHTITANWYQVDGITGDVLPMF